MLLRKEESWILAVDSPLEFVITGPKGKRDGVLIRSDNMGPDLLGYAIRGRDRDDSRDSEPPVITDPMLIALRTFRGVIESRRRRLNVVSSARFVQNVEEDERNSAFGFAWVGDATAYDRKRVQETFSRHVIDLRKAIDAEEIDRIEWSISPSIYECLSAHERRKARGSFVRAYIAVVAAAGSLAGLVALAAALHEMLKK
jgi:hypothetical protein